MSAAAVVSMTDEDELRAELLGLPGCERVIWAGPSGQPGLLGGVDVDPNRTATWLRLLAAMATRSSAELELGTPRLITLNLDARMIALAIEADGAILAVISRDPSALGLAMVKLRRWLDRPQRGRA